jgi:hypothetical protein
LQNFRRATLGFVAQAFQQLSGINLISYYAAYIYENSIGLSPFLSRLLAALNGQSGSCELLLSVSWMKS